jgi:hypothetical protein
MEYERMKCALNKSRHRELTALIEAFDTAKSSLTETLQATLDDWEEEYENSSERWQESDAGQAADERRSQLQEWIDSLEEIDTFDLDNLAGA